MTLLIAYLLMANIGITDPIGYLAVFILWVMHCAAHAGRSK